VRCNTFLSADLPLQAYKYHKPYICADGEGNIGAKAQSAACYARLLAADLLRGDSASRWRAKPPWSAQISGWARKSALGISALSTWVCYADSFGASTWHRNFGDNAYLYSQGKIFTTVKMSRSSWYALKQWDWQDACLFFGGFDNLTNSSPRYEGKQREDC
jgi:hypothetical protein